MTYDEQLDREQLAQSIRDKDAEIERLQHRESSLVDHVNQCDRENESNEREIERLREGLSYLAANSWAICGVCRRAQEIAPQHQARIDGLEAMRESNA